MELILGNSYEKEKQSCQTGWNLQIYTGYPIQKQQNTHSSQIDMEPSPG